MHGCTRAWLLCGVLLAACDDAPKPDTHPANLLLTIDGLDITLDEVEQHVKFLDADQPEWATKVKFRRVLEEFTIPLRLAQRAFPEQRAEMRKRAENLRSVADNTAELEQQGAQQVIKRKDLGRRQVELPVAEFLFNPLLTGSASQPIEVPRGFIVAGAYGLKESAQVINDLVEAVQVGFLTHTPGDWQTWKDNEQLRVADKATYVNPAYRDSMPEWIKLP
jgi:hypothetical protein